MFFQAGKLIFSPSDLVNFLDGDFGSWMDRWYIESKNGNSDVVNEFGLPLGVNFANINGVPDEQDGELQLVAAKGIEHEENFLRQLTDEGRHVEIINNDTEDRGAELTIKAMREGAEFIYQGRLGHEEFAGFADFLARTEGDSDLGDYHYEAWDTKLARSFKPYFIVQLCSYSEMITAIQGQLPHSFSAVLGTGTIEQRSVQKFLYYFRSLRRRFLDFHNEFTIENFPHPGFATNHGRWSTFAKSYIEATDHLSVVANITRGQIKKLQAAGIDSLRNLATTSTPYVPRLTQPIFERLKVQARLQLESKERDRPLYEVRPPSLDNPRLGLGLLPPSSPKDVFFDIEGYPFAEDGLEYLLGAICIEDNQPQFYDWWAHSQQQERHSFQEFIDWVYARWNSDRKMHIYHYAPYETSAMCRLMGKHATREAQVDDLLRHGVFVDLYKVVRQGLIVGTPSYSLKDIEHLYMDGREGEVVTAGGSVVAYHKWIESGQSGDWRESNLLREIRDYNEEDCVSTWKLAEWLWNVQKDSGINFVPLGHPSEKNNGKDGSAATKDDHPATRLADKLLGEVTDGQVTDPQQAEMQTLLGGLLGYHWREAKPVFWRMFARNEMSERELIEEFDCLGGLQRTAKPPHQVKRSWVYEYQFAPEQDTKLHEGSSCFFSHDLSVSTTIERLDPDQGLVEIKLGPKHGEPPGQLSLIPNEYVSAQAIAEAVFRYVEAWNERTILSQAADDLLLRQLPRLSGHGGGPIIPEGADLTLATVDAIQRMDDTVLCIQGPPGSGKTYTAAAAICQLLQDGKRVGVTANSHKAILNVLHAVHKRMKENGDNFRIVKIGSSTDDPLIENGEIENEKSNADGIAVLGNGPVVMGGTAWLFARPELQGKFDYLFIDEAGQFSLANTVAVGLSTNNLVLVGDQMQLAQPIQGTHPGDSGQSALNYLLAGHDTIPPEMGIFLDRTWRLHPDICRFISDAVYEGRLQSHPRTADQRIENNGGLISKQAGICFVPVEHEGNSQGCEEEVVVIADIVEELIGCQYWDAEHSMLKELTLDDLLIVAPFNMQVRLVSKHLGPNAKIGSVDKFQGQEAQIVIVSMCSSTLEDSPRGAEFLFEPNRLNVAISRAKTLAIIVGSPDLASARCQTIRDMELANLFCWLVDYARGET
ncbi:hypothetical protein Pan258_29840 [Symmachiella dynata]|uniref:TM0106 family RecB-like putative nuclease n=1 Tax=Symmachiella dynata TaxID=2527995 RepID=UPI00118986EE|nr:TM0106 family RecB-like putative nuclease [Symmachiella dynata]QDT48937.1 hypothetical protein Pan258_29840 [Symmachiella dynata]